MSNWFQVQITRMVVPQAADKVYKKGSLRLQRLDKCSMEVSRVVDRVEAVGNPWHEVGESSDASTGHHRGACRVPSLALKRRRWSCCTRGSRRLPDHQPRNSAFDLVTYMPQTQFGNKD